MIGTPKHNGKSGTAKIGTPKHNGKSGTANNDMHNNTQ